MGTPFGDEFRSPPSTESARWIDAACRGSGVGRLVPNEYPLVLRVHPPDSEIDDWWTAYRDLYAVVAEVGARHTATPDRAWFAIWDGHGWTNSSAHIAWREAPRDDEERNARANKLKRFRDAHERRKAAVGAALRTLTTFSLPQLVSGSFFLLDGSVAAVGELREPMDADRFQNPDLFWPDDRRWFVGTHVDFWSLYIGADDNFIAELTPNLPTRSEIVAFDDPLPFHLED